MNDDPDRMTDRARTDPRHVFMSLTLLWLAGVALRLPILAVPPVIPMIHDDLNLSETEVGILTGLPSMLFAAAAVPGALLIARLGAVGALVTGLVLNAIGGALRGAVTDVAWLYAMTVVMAGGVAIMQVTLPPTVRTWLPQRIPFATAIYTNGLLIGEILPVAFMLSVALPLVGGSWPLGFVFWSVPVALTAVLVLIFSPRAQVAMPATRRWWPDWKSPLIWRLGIMLGAVNASYFTTNAFIPNYLISTGHREWISAALTALNLCQLPASFIMLAAAQRLERKVWPIITVGAICIPGTAGIVFGSGVWIVVAAGILGFAAAFILILTLALPPLLAPPDDVPRTTAAMFTISYSCAVIVPILSGLAWDLSGIPALAFVPIAACGVLLIALAPSVLHVGKSESAVAR